MTANNRIRILVENRAEQFIVEGILRAEIVAGEVYVNQCWGLSTMLGVAQFSLQEHPERPVALVVNANDQTQADVKDEILGPMNRMLSGTATNDWIVAIAHPNIFAWARADSRFDEVCNSENISNKHDLAVRFDAWSKAEMFERTSLSTSDPQFAELIEFLAAHAPAASS